MEIIPWEEFIPVSTFKKTLPVLDSLGYAGFIYSNAGFASDVGWFTVYVLGTALWVKLKSGFTLLCHWVVQFVSLISKIMITEPATSAWCLELGHSAAHLLYLVLSHTKTFRKVLISCNFQETLGIVQEQDALAYNSEKQQLKILESIMMNWQVTSK